MKLISFDLQADFAFFRKPETNNTINLSYNIIHKPAVLGILGAIVGLRGYEEKGKLPEYYEKFKGLQVGIEPLQHDKGNFAKTNIKYSNTVGYANKGSNFLTEELTIVEPAFRIYLLLDEKNDLHNRLLESIKNAESVYIPYFGKNEFTAWWTPESYKEYKYSIRQINIEEGVLIKTLFTKEIKVNDNIDTPYPDLLNFNMEVDYFLYFERLPRDFDLDLMQYNLKEFAFSNYKIKNGQALESLYYLDEYDSYVQLL